MKFLSYRLCVPFAAVLALNLGACSSSSSPRDADTDEETATDAETDAEIDAARDGEPDTEVDGDDGGFDDPPDADEESLPDADGHPFDHLPRRGLILLAEYGSESEPQSSATVRFSPRRHPMWCGNSVETYRDCWLFRTNVPTCTPECTAEQSCVWNDDCTHAFCVDPMDPHRRYDAGEVTIEGATHQPDLTCSLSGDGYECDILGDDDFWETGALISVSAPGVTFPAFACEVIAPAPLRITTDLASWTLSDLDGSHDSTIEWEVDEEAAAAAVTIAVINTDARAALSCLSADDGLFDIPAEGLAALGPATSLELEVTRSNGSVANEGGDGEVKVYAESLGAALTFNEVPTP